jgi:hypothetical protein
MRLAILALMAVGAVTGACSEEAKTDQNVAIDINDADPSDIEAVPADETSALPEVDANGAANVN